MSELQPRLTSDVIKTDGIDFVIPNFEAFIQYVNDSESGLMLFDMQTQGSFGRVDSIDAGIFMDYKRGKHLDVHFDVRPEHGVTHNSLIREMPILREKLRDSEIEPEQITVSEQNGLQVLTIFITPEHALQLFAYRTQAHNTITVRLSVALSENSDQPVVEEILRKALETTGIVAGKLASSWHLGRKVDESLVVNLANYSPQELDEKQVAIVMFFERQKMLVEDLDSPNAPIFCFEGISDQLLELATEYREVDIVAIEQAYELYTKSRYQFFKDAGIHPTFTIGDVRNVLAAAKSYSNA